MRKYLVIKHGGSAMEDPAHNRHLAESIADLSDHGFSPIVVHGGGKEINTFLDRLGIPHRFVDGQRYTDEAALGPIEMVLSGKINKELVRLLGEAGVSALGLSGKDGGLLLARRITEPDLGFVGEVHGVNVHLLELLCSIGQIPVISPMSVDDTGQTLNVNADYAAVSVAVALPAEIFLYITDVDGIRVDGKPLRRITVLEAEALRSHPDIQGGMIPKLECAIRAIHGGVQMVKIVDGTSPRSLFEYLGGAGEFGTTITR